MVAVLTAHFANQVEWAKFEEMERNWKFNTIDVRNRWKTPRYARNCDWTIFGFSWWWSGPKEKSFRVHLFGIDISVWFCKNNNDGTK